MATLASLVMSYNGSYLLALNYSDGGSTLYNKLNQSFKDPNRALDLVKHGSWNGLHSPIEMKKCFKNKLNTNYSEQLNVSGWYITVEKHMQPHPYTYKNLIALYKSNELFDENIYAYDSKQKRWNRWILNDKGFYDCVLKTQIRCN